MLIRDRRINLFEKGKAVKSELETAEVLNKLFSIIVNNLEISNFVITSVQHFFKEICSLYIVILMLQTLQMMIRHIYLINM